MIVCGSSHRRVRRNVACCAMAGRFVIAACPAGVHELKGMEHDVRTVDKVFDGVNESGDAEHSYANPLPPPTHCPNIHAVDHIVPEMV